MCNRRSILILWEFCRRDYYKYKKQLRRYFVNFGIIRPVLYSISLVYIQANVIFGSRQSELCTIFFTGNAMIILMVLTFSLNFKLSFDMKHTKFIEYQITLLPPHYIFLQRILFTSFFAGLIFFPFFPVAKLLLRHQLLTNNASWLQVGLVLVCATLCFSAYNTLCACVMKNPRENIVSLWLRLNIPMQVLGGMWAPLYIVKNLVPWMSYILYLNPIIYITEGLRRAILGNDKFLSVGLCCTVLLAMGATFLVASLYFFKKRMDYV